MRPFYDPELDDEEQQRLRVQPAPVTTGAPLVTRNMGASPEVPPAPVQSRTPLGPPEDVLTQHPTTDIAPLRGGLRTVAPPAEIRQANYMPKPLTGWRKGLGLLGLGMSAFASPQQGAEAYQNLFVRPGERGQKRFEAAQEQRNKEIEEQRRQEDLERQNRAQESTEKLQAAQAEKATQPVPDKLIHAYVGADSNAHLVMQRADGNVYERVSETEVRPPTERQKSFEQETYEEWLPTHPGGTRMQFEAERKRPAGGSEDSDSSKLLTPTEAGQLGVPYGTKRAGAFGQTPSRPLTDYQRQTTETGISTLDAALSIMAKIRPDLDQYGSAVKGVHFQAAINAARESGHSGIIGSAYNAAITRSLDERSKKLLGNWMSAQEHIQRMRAVMQGAAGFRSVEAFETLLGQLGSPAADPKTTKETFENSYATLKGYRDVLQRSLGEAGGAPPVGAGGDGGGQFEEGTIRTNRRTQEKQIMRNGQWVAVQQ